ncbi:hypothetical protein M406DRAFT_353470 [Cryphonectria parasitica EP155]|uniref:SP-RING-type domain-containing protein n=1 Tax=Cryphonectria parasitica (strain ATCC 38755 / EP155) TaxID=660469 RepID=A0A9P4XTJ5_CRYP1|nr:uncharacterized protein M406DRAFT_353470 [Cryphonectria parasitica EP155]KAF3760643.1 hypothetical protein M406DRAFT_353470 [Cryphonectria parasitica EP155]
MPSPLMGADAAFSSQVAHANSTLNKFMPGRQKAWMTSTTPAQSSSACMPPQSPSQPSPKRPRAQGPRNVRVPHPQVQDNVRVAGPQQPAGQKDGPPAHELAETVLNVLPSPAPSDEPSPLGPNTKDSSNPASVPRPAGPPERRDTVPATAAADATASDALLLASPHARAPAVEDAAAAPLSTGRQVNVGPDDGQAASFWPPQNNRAVPPNEPGALPPSTGRTEEGPRMQARTNSAGDGEPPGKRRCIGPNDNSFDVDQHAFIQVIQYLDKMLVAPGPEVYLPKDCEEPRIKLLRDACIHRDIFYVNLHSLICKWALGSASLPPCPPRDHDEIFNGFVYLGLLLKQESAELSEGTLRWAAHFPPDQLYTVSPQTVEKVTAFFAGFVRHWITLLGEVRQRGYPCLVDELMVRIKCESRVMQKLLFTMCRRKLDIRDGDPARKVEDIFAEDLRSHCDERGVLRALDLPNIAGGVDLASRNAKLIQKYRDAMAEIQAAEPRTVGNQSQQVWHRTVMGPQRSLLEEAQRHQAEVGQYVQQQAHQQPVSQQQQLQHQFPYQHPEHQHPNPQQQNPPSQHQNSQQQNLQPHPQLRQAPMNQDQQMQQPGCNKISCTKLKYAQLKYAQLKYAQLKYAKLKYAQLKCNKLKCNKLKCRELSKLCSNKPTTPGTEQQQLPPLQAANGGATFGTHPQHMPPPAPQWSPAHLQNAMSGQNRRTTSDPQNVPTTVSYSARPSPFEAYSDTSSPFVSQMSYGSPTGSVPTVPSHSSQGPQHSFLPSNLPNAGPALQGPAMQGPMVQAAASPQQSPLAIFSPQQGQLNAPQQVQDGNQHRIWQSVPHSAQYQAQWAAGQGPVMIPSPRTPAMPNVGPMRHANGFVPALAGNMQQPYLRPSTPHNASAVAMNGAPRPVSRLVPPRGQVFDRRDYPHTSESRRSVLMSLHQAQARSPDRTRCIAQPDERYYQYVESFALAPFRLTYHHELQLEISPEQASRACRQKAAPGCGGHQMLMNVCEYSDGSLRFRARCCRLQSDGPVQESDWVLKEALWPEHIFLEFNGHQLPIRRSTHNGKDLAVELTNYVLPGKNSLKATVPHAGPSAADKRGNNFYLAVEIIETVSHSRVLKQIEDTHRPDLQKTLEKIRSRVTAAPDKDGIAVIDRTGDNARELSIDLTDPFSSTIFHIPARSVACTHMECFDLETWLNTRPAKQRIKCSHQGGCTCPKRLEPSEPDKWKCPICFLDARPGSLYIDSFLDKVRQQLEEQKKLDTKSILVAADGSWRPADKPKDDDSGDSPAGRPRSMSMGTAEPTQTVLTERGPVEIIEID